MAEVIDTSKGVAMELDNSDQFDHPTKISDRTIIPLTEVVKLGYCKNTECGCKSVHCPFCDKSHFKPAKPSRVRDHMELKHFAHAVKFDDVLIVKCFRDCGDKPNGHYHCRCCTKQILKRNAFHSHLVSHIKDMKKSADLVTAPDDKLPQKIVFQGSTLMLCLKACSATVQEHFHCPQCQRMFVDRSMLITHMWRCRGSKVDGFGQKVKEWHADPSQQTDVPHPKDANDVKWHVSIVQSVGDLPMYPCVDPTCDCDGKHHCVMCPASKFKPNTYDHLKAHYALHWRKRIPYKDYFILICYLRCEGSEETYGSQRYHYHCPVCGECRKRRDCFSHHLRICQGNRKSTHRFSMGKFKEEMVEVEQLGHDAEAAGLGLSESDTAVTPTAADQPGPHSDSEEQEAMDTVPYTPIGQLDRPDDALSDLTSDVAATDLSTIPVFEKVTATLSQKLIEAVDIETLDSVLSKVAGETGVVLNWSPGISSPQYTLSGQSEDIVLAKRCLRKYLLNAESSTEDLQNIVCRKCGSPDFMADIRMKDTVKETEDEPENGPETRESNKESKPIPSVKKTRGRPRKIQKKESSEQGTGNSNSRTVTENLPREIMEDLETESAETAVTMEINASSQQHSWRKERKPSVGESNGTSGKESVVVVTTSPKRYSTRGRKVDFSAMVGGKRMRQGRKEPNINRNDVTEKRKSKSKSKDKEHDPCQNSGHPHMSQSENVQEKLVSDSSALIDFISLALKHSEVGPENCDEDGQIDDTGDFYNNKLDHERKEEERRYGKNVTPTEARKGDNVAHIPMVVFEDCVKLGRRSLNFFTTENGENEKDVHLTCDVSDACDDLSDVKTLGEDDGSQISENVVLDRCYLCGYESGTFHDLLIHLKTFHHLENPASCDVCEVIFIDDEALQKHLNQKHQPKTRAMKSIINPDILKKNSLSRKTKLHRKELKCPKCSYTALGVHALYTHREFVHKEIPVCEFCGKRFARFMHMQTHIQAIHTKSKSAVCEICGKNFDHVRYMKVHMKRHLDIKSHQCNICGRKFSESTILKGHMETHKQPEDKSFKYVCDYCGKRFLNRSNYMDHLNKHTGDKPYACKICGKTFAFKSVRENHVLFKHTKEKPYQCPLCQKAFKMKRLLEQHLVLHTGRSSFVCEECGRAFSCKNTLKIHRPKCKGGDRQKPGSGVILVLAEQGDNQSDQVAFLSNAVMAMESQVSGVEAATQSIVPEGIVHVETVQEQSMVDSALQEGGEPALYICSECNAVFENFQEVERHVLLGHAEGSNSESVFLQPHQVIDAAEGTADPQSATTMDDVTHESAVYLAEVDASTLIGLSMKEEHSV